MPEYIIILFSKIDELPFMVDLAVDSYFFVLGVTANKVLVWKTSLNY